MSITEGGGRWGQGREFSHDFTIISPVQIEKEGNLVRFLFSNRHIGSLITSKNQPNIGIKLFFVFEKEYQIYIQISTLNRDKG